MDWYACFLAAVFLLWLASTPSDRNALRIVLIASLLSELVVELVTVHIHGAWKLAIPGAVETLTILAMLHWARNRTGYLQASLLIVAWLAHLICYVDAVWKTDLVYSRYEIIIQMVAVGQLAACYDTLFSIAGRLAHSFRAGCVERLFPARTRASLLPSGRSPRH